MKKKLITLLVALITCIACALGLVACGAQSVAGKTFVFESITIQKGADGVVKELAEAMLKEMFADSTVSFDNDGGFTMVALGETGVGTYTQSGSTVTATIDGEEQEIKVDGDRISLVMEQQGMSVRLIYVLGESGSNNETDNVDPNPEEGTAEQDDVLAGTVYVLTDCIMDGESKMEFFNSDCRYTFGNDGSCTIYVNSAMFGESTQSGAYTVSDNVVTVTVDGSSHTLEIGDNTLPQIERSSGFELYLIYTLQTDA